MSMIEQESDVEQKVYRTLSRTFMLLDDFDRQFCAEHGLSTRQFWALKHLDEHQGRSMIELSRLLFTDKSNVTSIIDHLERVSYAVRTPDPHDRRVILVTLTAQGAAYRNSIAVEHHARVRELIGVVDASRLDALLVTLDAVGQNIELYLGGVNSA